MDRIPFPFCPPDAAQVGYTMLRSIGFMLDELSAQGLVFWRDEEQAWWWRWDQSTYHAPRGFSTLGEAFVDAVVTRFPAHFDVAEPYA